MNKTIKNYLNTKIELNALIVEMKKYGTANNELTQFHCFDKLSYAQHDKFHELKKELHYIDVYFLNYVKMKKYVFRKNITIEYATERLNKWKDLKFRYDVSSRLNDEERRFYDNIIHKVNRYGLMVEILNERN